MVPFSTSYCGAPPIDQQMHHHLPDSIQQQMSGMGSTDGPVVVDVK